MNITILLFASTLIPVVQGGRTSAPQPPDLDTLPVLRLVEEMRIGSASDPNTGFARVGSVAVDRAGQVYVYELQDRQIRVYSPTGQLVRTIGRRGNGPGEFTASIGFGIKGDTVWTREQAGFELRLALFDRRNGALISTARTAGIRVPGRASTQLLLLPAEMRADGNFISGVALMATMRGATPTGIAPSDTLRIPRILFNSQGVATDTLSFEWQPPSPGGGPAREYVTGSAGGRFLVPVPFPETDISVYTPDGRYVVQRPAPQSAAKATVRVERLGLRGNNLYSRSYTYTPFAYTATVLDTIAGRTNAGPMIIIDGVAQPRATETPPFAAIRQAMSFPQFQPPVQAYFFAADGTLWLRREENGGPTYTWVPFDAQGNPRGRLELQRGLTIVWTSGDVLWAERKDDNDVPWLVKYRISR